MLQQVKMQFSQAYSAILQETFLEFLLKKNTGLFFKLILILITRKLIKKLKFEKKKGKKYLRQ